MTSHESSHGPRPVNVVGDRADCARCSTPLRLVDQGQYVGLDWKHDTSVVETFEDGEVVAFDPATFDYRPVRDLTQDECDALGLDGRDGTGIYTTANIPPDVAQRWIDERWTETHS
jgi:hypothetical protein